jgi:hypothetical protein
MRRKAVAGWLIGLVCLLPARGFPAPGAPEVATITDLRGAVEHRSAEGRRLGGRAPRSRSPAEGGRAHRRAQHDRAAFRRPDAARARRANASDHHADALRRAGGAGRDSARPRSRARRRRRPARRGAATAGRGTGGGLAGGPRTRPTGPADRQRRAARAVAPARGRDLRLGRVGHRPRWRRPGGRGGESCRGRRRTAGRERSPLHPATARSSGSMPPPSGGLDPPTGPADVGAAVRIELTPTP